MKNRRIGIITQLSLDTVNFGNHLQAYALNHYINSRFEGVDAETILLKEDTGLKFTTVKGFLKHHLLKIKRKTYRTLFGIEKVEERYKRFKAFAQQNIRLSKQNVTFSEVNKSSFDALIVGSDVVWYQTSGFVDLPRFLPFYANAKRRFAYAASFGNGKIPEENIPIIVSCLKKFDRIAVREASAKELLSQIEIHDVSHTCDPTMLLSDYEWREISVKPAMFDKEGLSDYIFAYFLGDSEAKIKELQCYCEEKGIRLLYIPYSGGLKKKTESNRIDLIDCSPQEWLWLIDNAKYVITDSFHGLVFSIIFETEFVSIKRNFRENINSRITDLLSGIGAIDKMVDISDVREVENMTWEQEKYKRSIEKFINDSKTYLDDIVGSYTMINISDRLCTGCTICGQICPKKAISFEVRNGFRFPVVNKAKCIECHLCEERCPAIGKSVEKNSYPTVYSAWTNDAEQRKKSTSGGVCFELSKFFIEQGGYVCGVAWSEGYKNAEYVIAHSLEELSSLSQTKYFQPEMHDIFIKVKELLVQGQKVLFIGTSCSNAAMLSFLGKKYDNLFCLDFICRGYTSQLYHKKRVEELEKEYNAELSFVQYKEKSVGWEKFGTRFSFNNGKSYYINRADDPYEYMLQIDDYITRMSCFDCQYRTAERVSDITLGDFWGIQGLTDNDYKHGVSAVLINTEKGNALFNNIAKRITFQRRNVWEITRGNHCLLGQLQYKEGREQFYNDLDTCTIKEIHQKYGNIKLYKLKRAKMNIVRAIKEFAKVSIPSFVYFNFISKNVNRDTGKYIFPYRGSRIVVDKGAEIMLHGSIYLNSFKHKKSLEEAYLHIYPQGKLVINGRVRIAAGSTVDVLSKGELQIGQSDTNFGTVIVCSNKIRIGDGVEMGRDVTIYDSNFHPTKFNKNVKGRPLVIGDHVWLCTGACIAKGVTIGDGAICGINSTVTRNVKERTSVLGNPAKCIMENVDW